jgi:hypothetical protein
MLVNQAVRCVQYIDYRTEHPYQTMSWSSLLQTRAFAHEQEIRLIRQELPTGPARNGPDGRAIKMGPPPAQRGIEVRSILTN